MKAVEEEVALILLRNKILSFYADKPFVFQSGMIVPIYCDNRELLFLPEVRNRIVNIQAETIKQMWPEINVIAGVATAGIPWGALVAGRLDLPFIYVRKERKNHGREKRIEGRLPTKEQNIGLIEDLISTGESFISAALAIREEVGAEVKGGAIFTYELPEAQEGFAREGLEVVSLSNITVILRVALREGFLTEERVRIIEQWRDDPWNWGEKMGFSRKH
ncbi:orotate phosphoribosyltransferase [bacterium]|nr:orotate phosphoribosyltransferase [bacterium]PIV65292.1 MAG: orotate phosphoribosyltransferase [Candidatus Nealsonbacteria bacterium CG01_land_8_20_14_3_00_12]